jgi:hypothetical protein
MRKLIYAAVAVVVSILALAAPPKMHAATYVAPPTTMFCDPETGSGNYMVMHCEIGGSEPAGSTIYYTVYLNSAGGEVLASGAFDAAAIHSFNVGAPIGDKLVIVAYATYDGSTSSSTTAVFTVE